MLYYLGSHNWLWALGVGGGGGLSARARCPRPIAFALSTCHSHPLHMLFTRLPHIPCRLRHLIHSTPCRPLAITIHPPASFTTASSGGLGRLAKGSPGPNAHARAYAAPCHLTIAVSQIVWTLERPGARTRPIWRPAITFPECNRYRMPKPERLSTIQIIARRRLRNSSSAPPNDFAEGA